MKQLLTFLACCIPLFCYSQESVKVTESEVLQVIMKLEDHPVEIVELKTLKKWKALDLSHEMKPKMDYNVVRVKYKTRDTTKLLLFDVGLVPIQYSEGLIKD